MDKSRPVAALVGGNSLLGRELREVLVDTPFRTKLIGADADEGGLLIEDAGEPVILTQLDQDNLAGAAVVFLAGSLDSSRRALDLVAHMEHRPAIVDLTYALDDHPGAYLRAPAAEPAHYSVPVSGEHAIAHPAAILLAVFLARLQHVAPITRAIAHVFEPASERGNAGLDELQKQTVNLLTFKELPKKIYDEQVAFNLLARYGTGAPLPLEGIELRIERHLASLLALTGGVPMPSIRVIQAPVFHGHSVSIWAEFAANPGAAVFEAALGTAQIDVRGPDFDPPNIVGAAGQSGIAVGAIAADRNDARSNWFWVVADNFRILAENAVAVARSIVGHNGAGKPQ